MKIFTSAALLAALAVVLVHADVATIKADLASIDKAVADLNTRLQSNNIGYLTALGIHISAQDLDKDIQTGIADVKANKETVTDADAKDIIKTLNGTEINVASATSRLATLKPTFDRLGVTGIAKQDVVALAADTKSLGKALVAAAPSAEKAEAQALADKFNADLAAAATAYGA